MTADTERRRADFLAQVDRRADDLAGLTREHDRQARQRTAETLAAGRWADAGGGLEVRLEPERSC